MDAQKLIRYFDGEVISDPNRGNIIFTPYKIGELVLTSGKLVACDPLVNPNSEPFEITLTPGRYPVILSVAHIQKNNNQRVAYAMLRLSDRTPARWEMATVPGEDLSSLPEGYIFGYDVDSGTGCFMDAEVGQIIDDSIYADTEEEILVYQLLERLEKTQIPTWCWADMCIDKKSQANVIAFTSGWGDGVYITYFGYDADNNIVSVVTDFEF